MGVLAFPDIAWALACRCRVAGCHDSKVMSHIGSFMPEQPCAPTQQARKCDTQQGAPSGALMGALSMPRQGAPRGRAAPPGRAPRRRRAGQPGPGPPGGRVRGRGAVAGGRAVHAGRHAQRHRVRLGCALAERPRALPRAPERPCCALSRRRAVRGVRGGGGGTAGMLSLLHCATGGVQSASLRRQARKMRVRLAP